MTATATSRLGREVVDEDADVVHALDRHALDGGPPARARVA